MVQEAMHWAKEEKASTHWGSLPRPRGREVCGRVSIFLPILLLTVLSNMQKAQVKFTPSFYSDDWLALELRPAQA